MTKILELEKMFNRQLKYMLYLMGILYTWGWAHFHGFSLQEVIASQTAFNLFTIAGQ